jgi:DNA invertase Pin-like site-specific DNA recombinase
VAGREEVVRGKPTTVTAPKPRQDFLRLAAEGRDLDDVKREYVRAVFHLTGSVMQTARVLKCDRATVYRVMR